MIKPIDLSISTTIFMGKYANHIPRNNSPFSDSYGQFDCLEGSTFTLFLSTNVFFANNNLTDATLLPSSLMFCDSALNF